MNTINIKALAIAVSLAFSAGAMAQTLTKSEYQAGKDKISGEYEAARATCTSLSGNANDVCVAEAKGQDKVARAELSATYQPSVKNTYKVSVAKAEAVYAVANERCDDKSGNVKDVCVKEAKAAQAAAKADAEVQLKTSDANAKANEKTGAAQEKADKAGVDARKDAAEDKRDARKDAAEDKSDAQYAVAKEKCDALSGAAKDSCLSEAKAHYNK